MASSRFFIFWCKNPQTSKQASSISAPCVKDCRDIKTLNRSSIHRHHSTATVSWAETHSHQTSQENPSKPNRVKNDVKWCKWEGTRDESEQGDDLWTDSSGDGRLVRISSKQLSKSYILIQEFRVEQWSEGENPSQNIFFYSLKQ